MKKEWISIWCRYADEEPAWYLKPAYILNKWFAAFKDGDTQRWNVTHLPSGYMVTRVRLLKNAKAMCAELVTLTDWNCSTEVIKNDLLQREDYRAIIRKYS